MLSLFSFYSLHLPYFTLLYWSLRYFTLPHLSSPHLRVSERINEYVELTVAVGAGLFEEALAIFKRFKLNAQAIDVIITYIKNLDRAQEFAERINTPDVYAKLGNAYLTQNNTKSAIGTVIYLFMIVCCSFVVVRIC